MSRTKRVYNKEGKIYNVYHPYKVYCMGNCHRCKDPKADQKERTQKKVEYKLAVLT